MITDRRFIAKFATITLAAIVCGRVAMCDENPTNRTSLKVCEIRRASTLLHLGTMLKQGDYTGAKYLLQGLTSTFADCQGVLKPKLPVVASNNGPDTIASFSTRLINKVFHNWTAALAVEELDSVRFKAQARKDVDQRCAHRVAETTKSYENWTRLAGVARALQASLDYAKKEQSRSLQKELTDQLWEAMARNDSAAKAYRLQVKACYNACAPIEPQECHPDGQRPPERPS